MKVTIHQPQYIPWLPYFLKIAAADCFVYLDSVSFQKNGLQNRNQILLNSGPSWLTVPVKQRLGTAINHTELNDQMWAKKHFKTVSQAYAKAPFFKLYHDELEALYLAPYNHLAELNIAFTKAMMRWLDIHTPTTLASELNVDGASTELLVNVCQATRATEYLSGMGGKNYMDESLFEAANIQITYVPSPHTNPYSQAGNKGPFVADLSALDILFNCGPDWRAYLA